MSRMRPASDALEARVAARLIGAVVAAQAPLAPDTAERLRFARQMALERARALRAAAARAPAAVGVGRAGAVLAFGGGATGGLSFGNPVPWWQRAAALLPLVVLVTGLVGIDHWSTQERIATAADIDAALLADDLPPEAYADPGFVEFLRTEPPDAEP